MIDAKTKKIIKYIPYDGIAPNSCQFFKATYDSDNEQLYISALDHKIGYYRLLVVNAEKHYNTINIASTIDVSIGMSPPVAASKNKIYLPVQMRSKAKNYDCFIINPIDNSIEGIQYHNIMKVTPNQSGDCIVDKEEKILYANAYESVPDTFIVISHIQEYSTIDDTYLEEFFDDGLNSGAKGFILKTAIDFKRKILYSIHQDDVLFLYAIDLETKKEINKIAIPIYDQHADIEIAVNSLTGYVHISATKVIYTLEKYLLDFEVTVPAYHEIVPANQPVVFKGTGQPDANVNVHMDGFDFPCVVQSDGTWAVQSKDKAHAGRTYNATAKEIINGVMVAVESFVFTCQ